jgi:glutamyl-tRNA synthetase
MSQTITRFAPSPSGYLHVGGARTAIFNWLFARHAGGKFILRIEDTDAERSTDESVAAILDGMTWLGLDWDEGPVFQSQRMPVYREHVQALLDKNAAYVCTCPPEAIEKMRQAAMAAGGKPKYDGSCREKGLPLQDGAVVRFKAPLMGKTILNDAIKGDIAFQNDELDDFVIQRSNGTPTYNFAVVVDDLTMKVNTVIRGDDHVMNTPKQILLYRALEAPLPVFGHVPMVLGADRSRLSKRHGAMSVTAYREMGYLPEAMVNYLVRLGWSHGDQEFFQRDELIEAFTLESCGRSAGIFDLEKLQALNAEHIQAKRPSELIAPLTPFLREEGIQTDEAERIERIIASLQPRSKTLAEMSSQALFYFEDNFEYEEKPARKFLKANAVAPLKRLAEKLSSASDFSEAGLESVFKAVMDETGLKLGKIAQPVRVALTGRSASPGIFEIVSIIGRDRVLARLKRAIAYIESKTAG